MCPQPLFLLKPCLKSHWHANLLYFLQHLDPAVLLDRGKSSKKKKSNPDNMPASLRKMLQLKAAAEGKPPPPRFQPPQKSDTNPEDVRNKPAGEKKTEETTEIAAEDTQEQVQEQQQPIKKRGPDNSLPLPAAQQKPSLKARKKDFLKKKKLRKKGKYVPSTAGSDSDEDSDPELRLKRTAMATKPKFAEQAAAPLQVNLKRKHWKEDGRTNSDRCNEIFARQMNNAKRQQQQAGGGRGTKAVKEAERVEVIEAYRKIKKGNTTGATLQSLADLVKKDHVSTM
jgi:hypothetical protein